MGAERIGMRTYRKINDHKVNLAIVAAIAAAYEHTPGHADIEVAITLDDRRIGARIREIRESGVEFFTAAMVGIHHNKMEGHFSERALWNIAHTFGDLIEQISVLTGYKSVKLKEPKYSYRFHEFYDRIEAPIKTVFFDRSIIRRAKAKYLRRCARGFARKSK